MPPRITALSRGRAGLMAPILLALLVPTLVVTGYTHAAAQSAVGAGSAPRQVAVHDRRPNIVMVMADDMRVDDLLFAPNVRRLIGNHGLTFENSFSPFPLCCPARASFLTGMYAHNHKVYWHEKPYGYGAFDDSRTLATSLSAAGYRTGFVGKYLNGYGQMRSKVSGKPSWKYVPNGWTDWIGSFQNPGVRGIHGGTYNYFDTPYNVNGRVDNRYRGRYQTNVVGDFSLKLLRKYHHSTSPFFLYLSYVAPHHGSPREKGDPRRVRRVDGTYDSFQTPARPKWVKGRFNRIITRAAGMPKNGGPSEADMSDKPSFMQHRKELSHPERVALTNVTRQRAEAVYVLDQQVGRLVRSLKATGEWDNTVLMFTSDNGYFLGEHRQRTGKVRAHEPSLRVPFLITGPGMRTKAKRYDPISTVDITATILDIAHAAPPHSPDGTSRLATMLTGDHGWTVPVVTEAVHTTRGPRTAAGFPATEPRTSIGLRTARYSFTLYRDGQGELYDLLTDPAENNSQFKNPTYADVRAALTEQWWQYKDCAGVTCRAPMPESLQASASQENQWTARYWDTINTIYGWPATRLPGERTSH